MASRIIKGHKSRDLGKMAERIAIEFYISNNCIPIKIKESHVTTKSGHSFRKPQICDFIVCDTENQDFSLVDIKTWSGKPPTPSYFNKNQKNKKTGKLEPTSIKKQFNNFYKINKEMGMIGCYFHFVDIEKNKHYVCFPRCIEKYLFDIEDAIQFCFDGCKRLRCGVELEL